MLSIAATLLDADHVVGFEIDSDAIEVARSNLNELELNDRVDIVQADLTNLQFAPLMRVDTVIMNPPFGTKTAGIDMVFLKRAVEIGNVVYSLHKTSTRAHLEKKAREWNCSFEVLAELKVHDFFPDVISFAFPLIGFFFKRERFIN